MDQKHMANSHHFQPCRQAPGGVDRAGCPGCRDDPFRPKPPGDFDPLFRPTPLPVIEGTTTAAQPPAILSSEYKLTNGVVLAVVSILVIVILGTLLYIRRYNRKTRG